jgi:hypothetical protein
VKEILSQKLASQADFSEELMGLKHLHTHVHDPGPREKEKEDRGRRVKRIVETLSLFYRYWKMQYCQQNRTIEVTFVKKRVDT